MKFTYVTRSGEAREITGQSGGELGLLFDEARWVARHLIYHGVAREVVLVWTSGAMEVCEEWVQHPSRNEVVRVVPAD